jgi:WhiB family transcriptional regulator, redox-sensing transcriptional regulator
MRIDTAGCERAHEIGACHPDGLSATGTDGMERTNPQVNDTMPSGLPFLRQEPPACSQPAAAEVFELAGGASDARNAVALAKLVCRTCPYVTECAEWAIGNGERWGIWGGTTFYERNKIRRERARLRLVKDIHG